jgi:hypothetical protein
MSGYGSDGVDVTLIRWMLSLTPDERLQTLEDFHNGLYEVLGEDAYNKLVQRSTDPR